MCDIIPDERVQCVWFCTACGQYESVPPTFYQESGSPMCCDLDMYYCHTRVTRPMPEGATDEE